MTRIQVTRSAAIVAIAAAATLICTAGTASADYPKCAHTKAVSKVCPNGGTNGTPEGGETRPSTEVPGSGDWGYTYNPSINRHEWGKKSD